MAAKTSTQLVRTTYLKLILKSKFIPPRELIPFILHSVENAINQSYQAQSVIEGLYGMCIILNMPSLDYVGENILQNIWYSILDTDKQVFVSDKFLSAATPEGILNNILQFL